jgi:peptide deformylase
MASPETSNENTTSPGRDALPVSPASAELPADGTIHPVTRWGAEVMHRKARPVTSYDEELRSLVADMAATMYAADGVGLAACQIGVDLAVFVFDCPDDDGTIHRGVVCNPVVELPEGKDRKLDDSE